MLGSPLHSSPQSRRAAPITWATARLPTRRWGHLRRLVATLEEGTHAFAVMGGLADAVTQGPMTITANECTPVEIVLRDGR